MPLPLAALAFLSAVSPPGAPAYLGTRDGLAVVLFPQPRPHVLRVLPAVVIVLREGAPVPGELRRRGASLGGRSWRLEVADPLAEAARWNAHPDVLAADPDALRPRRPHDFDDPGYGGQWYLEKLGMEALYAVSLGVPETRVAVIDSATDIRHPDLAAGVFAPFDTIDGDDDPSPVPGEFCPPRVRSVCDEHGTAVSGIIGARANNGEAIVGLCPACTLIPIRLITEGETPLSADVHAFEHAIAQDAAVINNSWGFTEALPVPRSLAQVIHRAATEPRGGLGALVVFAAGNDDREIFDDEVTGLPDVLCVSAVDSYGRPTAYTNRGASVAVSAPSATVSITPGGETTRTFGGTSAAAPVVSGLAAWALSVAPELSAAELKAALVETAEQSALITPDENGHHDVYGFGIVSPENLLARLVPPPPPEPDAALSPDAAPDATAPPPDAALPSDDAATGPVEAEDAGDSPDATASASENGGASGCAIAPRGAPGFVFLLALPLGLARRRRLAPRQARGMPRT